VAVQVSLGSCLRMRIDHIVRAIQHLRSFTLLGGRLVGHVKRRRYHVVIVGRKQSVDAIYIDNSLKALPEKNPDESRSTRSKS